ncbi:hypothetical protein J7443_23065 [Tropicibacter sp. R15_0]|uniref:hypothetical protein n=1 Tax=Tropicibacter sp. R15_0 TaxID=2821101 RepID=UPI001ADD4438|nr:hypothetical protein [Tropicibacter sp. R15_0]MBO9468125.1 hypothetical protein [Tropicibacter sp. R15_0]
MNVTATKKIAAWKDCLDAQIDVLNQAGYAFASEVQYKQSPLCPASSQAKRAWDKLAKLGRLPEFCLEKVHHLGQVDLRHAYPHDDAKPLHELAHFDPFVFDPEYLSEGFSEMSFKRGQKYFVEFAPDINHKADVSGGDGYGFWMETERASTSRRLDPQQLAFDGADWQEQQAPTPPTVRDVTIEPVQMPLLDYVDATLANGGFFGLYLDGGFSDVTRKNIETRDLGAHPILDELRGIAAKTLS